MKLHGIMALALSIMVQATGSAFGACTILDSHGAAVSTNSDAVARLLTSRTTCPRDVFALRSLLTAAGASLKTSFVGNRGFHNPGAGSFSLFEIVTGHLADLDMDIGESEFFFGHFTAVGQENHLIADQSNRQGALMGELIAWDAKKGVFNFYELRGDGGENRWLYRGDSLDIFADIQLLHRQQDPQHPVFGGRLRCSGCHMEGGPIMKEFSPPHNDWWRETRKLPLGGRQPDAQLEKILAGLVDADLLASQVESGVKKLHASVQYQEAKKKATLQEQLRPLFCPLELNLESDTEPLDANGSTVAIPTAFFVDPRLAQGAVAISGDAYRMALTTTHSQFPEVNRPDADHAWLTPVKAMADIKAVDALVQQGVIDDEFVSDVLAVEMTNPVFAKGRCELLHLVSERETPDWREAFAQALKQSPAPAAAELLTNLTDASHTRDFHRQQATQLLDTCRATLRDTKAVHDLYLLLIQRREEAKQSEISKNPRGQILEPGFRVIFPEVSVSAVPGQLTLDLSCQTSSR